MELTDLTWRNVDQLARTLPVVIPIAALEQHGHHLPLFTDSLLLGEILRRTRLSDDAHALFAPLMWLGNSHHHLDFPGTLSAEPRVYLDLLCGLADNFIRHGFRRIVFLNGHGGNDVPARQAVFELRQRHRTVSNLLLLSATYWNLGTPPKDLGLYQTEMGHACEWETSMILRIAPHLVGDYRNAPAVPPGKGFDPASRGWTTGERSAIGHIGWPAQADAAKGESLFQTFHSGVSDLIRRMKEWDGQSWDAPE